MSSLILKNSIIKTIVFDFDGTLAKLNIDFDLMRKSVLEIMSFYKISANDLHSSFVLEMINETGAILNKDSPQIAEMFTQKANDAIENIEVAAAADGKLFDRTKELLDSLKFQGIAFAIITRNCSRAVNKIFPDISLYCPAVICRNDVKNVKPHPDHLNKALQMLGGLPHSTLMIGDHPLDIKTGLNAGTFAAGVLTGRCLENDFVIAGADLVLSEAADILTMIN